MARKFNETYQSLICESIPKRKLRSKVDQCVGEKPHAADGFVVNYCLSKKEKLS